MLDHASFEALLAALDRDRGEAGRAYERLRQRTIRFFALHGAGDPEDLSDEALDRLARKLNEGEVIRNLPQYLAGIARLLLREEWSRMQRNDRNTRLGLAAGTAVEVGDPAQEALEACLKTIPATSCDLICRYYSAESRASARERRKMAAEMGISVNALRNRALRLRQELEKCVEKYLENTPKQDI
jgi:DNA-directed RNA polymerase specialized sigma24 family protein